MNQQTEVKKRFKTYKAKKRWVTAPILFLGVLGVVGLATDNVQAAELDTKPETTSVQPDNPDPQVDSTTPKTAVSEEATVQKATTSQPTKVEEVVPKGIAAEHRSATLNDTTNVQQPTVETEELAQEQPVVSPEKNNESLGQSTEVVSTGNEALDKVVKDAQNNGVDVKEEPEKTLSSKEEVDKEFKQQENMVKDTTNVQKEINKSIKDAVDKAKEQGVDVKETEKQTYKDKLKAQEDVKKQVVALEEAIKVMNEANKLIEGAIARAKQNGTPIKDGGILNATVKDAVEKAKQLVASIQVIDSENVEIKKRNADALEKYQRAKAELDAKNAKIKAENEAIAKRNKERQDLYNKLLQEYLNGKKLETKMDARTQSYNEQQQYKTFMKSEVDQKTGRFTLTHDMNDGVNIIGSGVLTGKINWVVTSSGDGSENVVINSIDLIKYVYTNLKPNSAVNKNIRFVVRDLQGNEIFRLNHDGERTISRDINKNVKYNNVKYKLKAGESTKMVEFLKVDDLWIYNTYGQVMIQFKNANEKPKTPDLEQEKPLDPTQLTPPTPEELKEAVLKKIVVTAEAHPVQLQTVVHRVKVAEKPVTPPATPMNTPRKLAKVPEKLVVEKASVAPELPHTGEKENTLLSVLGAGMLVSLSWFGLKKRNAE
ncbi:KxYKxGKxW signal peptide domain-containing protein [Enterococcus faecalis]|uniref:KxYKxGKxW signal peptide domain-containing protein n=1 Tax=Enterococcus faecalis TaxID=1351 RepID=UPI0004599A9D|nr:KxYKxGKxW signal peptide domain-containing protein [Enterococcus faecalis]KAJ82270.1 putative aggregation substance [Enterococcus faecalis NY9]